LSAYQNTYKDFLLPFSIKHLESTTRYLPLVFQKQRGKPTTKRIRKGAWKRKKTKCSKCHGFNHNIRKCKFAPAINGRQERARERQMSISDNSNSGSLSSNSSSDLDSEINEAALQDQAESDLYHEQVARAWEIIRRQEQEQESNNDAMEGIDVDSIDTISRVQDTVESPRHTRSGKVLKRIEN